MTINSESIPFTLISIPLQNMLGDDSILRRIPVAIEPKEALFRDGIRHAVEIMDLAYSRLREALPNVASDPPTSTILPKLVPHAFLDT